MSTADGAPCRRHRCRVCGVVYDEAVGDPDSGLPPGTRFEAIPEDWACPVCGVSKADFEPIDAAPAPARPAAAATLAPAGRGRAKAGVLIVGGGPAGWQVARALREAGEAGPITLLSACDADVVDKPLLSVAHARGLDPATLVRETADQAARRWEVRLRPRTWALRIELATRRLRSSQGPLAWDALVLAHGACPRPPAVLAADRVWRVQGLEGYRALRARLDGGPRRVAVVGAGLIGCELANDLALAGHAVALLDREARPLASLLPPAASARLLQAWSGLPLDFLGGVQVAAVGGRVAPGAARSVHLADGRVLEADEVVAATGVSTPDTLARSAGLAWDARAGGIVIDPRTGATSEPGLYAAGDCVVVDGRAERLIAPIAGQAAAIAAHLRGQAPPPRSAAEPRLAIKTTSCPILLRGPWAATDPAGLDWEVEQDDATRLRLSAVLAGGGRLRLEAGQAAA